MGTVMSSGMWEVAYIKKVIDSNLHQLGWTGQGMLMITILVWLSNYSKGAVKSSFVGCYWI